DSNAIVATAGKPDTLNQGDCISLSSPVQAGGLLYEDILKSSWWEEYFGSAWNEIEKTISGNWFKAKNKYLGLQVKANGGSFYGWVRLSCRILYPVHYVIKDYAINTIPSESIAAGDTMSCIYLTNEIEPLFQLFEWAINERVLVVHIMDEKLMDAE